MPFNDLRRPQVSQADDILAITRRVLESGWPIHGPQHQAFEGALARCVGTSHAVGVASGTDALEIALRATQTDDRKTVITVANAGGYTTVAALAVGLDVRFCDIDPSTLLMAPCALAETLDSDVFAVVVTHLYGRLAEVGAIRDLCADHDVAVIEDCAQAIGARNDNGSAGSLGDLATFSFYPTKNLGAIGDGGAITTSDDDLAARVRQLRQYGWSGKYTITCPGGRNSRLDELQAAVLDYRLPNVDEWNRRRDIIKAYSEATTPAIRVLSAQGDHHSGHLAVVEVEDSSSLARHLKEHGIQSAVHYPTPDHLQPAIKGTLGDVSLPVTERKRDRILSLPCFPELTSDEIVRVCDAMASYRG